MLLLDGGYFQRLGDTGFPREKSQFEMRYYAVIIHYTLRQRSDATGHVTRKE